MKEITFTQEVSGSIPITVVKSPIAVYSAESANNVFKYGKAESVICTNQDHSKFRYCSNMQEVEDFFKELEANDPDLIRQQNRERWNEYFNTLGLEEQERIKKNDEYFQYSMWYGKEAADKKFNRQ